MPVETDLPPGIDGEKVRRVAVRVVRLVAVRLPLLELAPTADLVRREVGLHIGHFRLVIGIHAQGLRHLAVVLEKVPDDLLVVHHAVLARSVLGRPAVGRDQRAVGEFLEMVLPVLADFLDHRIALFPQEPLVLGEGEMFGHVLGVPGAGRDVPFPAVAAENALAGAGGPAPRLATEGLPRGDAARLGTGR